MDYNDINCCDCYYKSSNNCCVKKFNSMTFKTMVITGISTLSVCVLLNFINVILYPYNSNTKIRGVLLVVNLFICCICNLIMMLFLYYRLKHLTKDKRNKISKALCYIGVILTPIGLTICLVIDILTEILYIFNTDDKNKSDYQYGLYIYCNICLRISDVVYVINILAFFGLLIRLRQKSEGKYIQPKNNNNLNSKIVNNMNTNLGNNNIRNVDDNISNKNSYNISKKSSKEFSDIPVINENIQKNKGQYIVSSDINANNINSINALPICSPRERKSTTILLKKMHPLDDFDNIIADDSTSKKQLKDEIISIKVYKK